MAERRILLSATSGPDIAHQYPINDLLSGSCTYGWKKPYPEALITVPWVPQQPATTWTALHSYLAGDLVKPTVRNGHVYQALGAATSGASQPTWPTGRRATVADGGVTWTEWGLDIVPDDIVNLTMGAGANNVLRFTGLYRNLNTKLARRMGLVCYGYMIRAAEFENSEDSGSASGGRLGGLLLRDFAGSAFPTEADVIKAVLTKALVPYTAGNILGTGVTWGTRQGFLPQVYMWRNGFPTNWANRTDAKGETATDYIHRWDAVSAVYTNASSPAGFYRTYETLNGVYRALIGGRPRNTVDLTFTEGQVSDIMDGQGAREYPTANRVFVSGMEILTGSALGPVSNLDSATLQGSNPFMPSTERHTYPFSSSFIEWSLESEGGVGMNCERVSNAIYLDMSRQTVPLRFTTGRDELILPGYTVLVRGTVGGIPDRFGIGENLWVDEVTAQVETNFRQLLTCTGGGTDAYTPIPPG